MLDVSAAAGANGNASVSRASQVMIRSGSTWQRQSTAVTPIRVKVTRNNVRHFDTHWQCKLQPCLSFLETYKPIWGTRVSGLVCRWVHFFEFSITSRKATTNSWSSKTVGGASWQRQAKVKIDIYLYQTWKSNVHCRNLYIYAHCNRLNWWLSHKHRILNIVEGY